MWQQIKDSEYFLSFLQDLHYEINVTDFISIWTASYSEADFLSLLKNSNDGLELENDEGYIKDGCNLLSKKISKILQSKIKVNGNSLHITMRILFEYPFCFQSKFTKGSEEVFFEKVTKPLLRTVNDLRSSQTEMRDMLLAKDTQVKAYERELENKKIIFRHEETKVFNEKEHLKKFKAYEETFGTVNIPESLIEKSVEIPQAFSIKQNPASAVPNIKQETTSVNMTPIIKQEPGSIKTEPNHVEQTPNNVTNHVIQIPKKVKEPESIKQEVVNIKEEPCTPVLDEPMPTINTQTLDFKQEVVKTEPHSSQMRINDRRKKIKLNY